MANHMVFKGNHMVQGQPWIIPTPYYLHMIFKVNLCGQPYGFQGQTYGSRSNLDYTYAILLAYDFQGQFMWPTIWFSRSTIWFKVKPGLYLRHTSVAILIYKSKRNVQLKKTHIKVWPVNIPS